MLEAVIILVLFSVNGILAMAEIAVVSSRKTRLGQMAEAGNVGARDALALAESPTQFLSTVQIGITLVGILAGAFGETLFAAPLAERLATVPALEPYANQIALVFVVLVITLLSLLIGELIPKRLALANPETAAVFLAPPMRVLARVAAPVVFVLARITDAVMAILRVSTRAEAVTAEEIKSLMEEGARSGVFAASESELVGRVFQLGDLDVSALMTPRPEIAAFDVRDSEETVRQKLAQHNRSRFPVVRGSLDEVLGIVKTKDLLAQYLGGHKIDLQAVMQPALFVPESMAALDLLEKFRAEHVHIALVTDEYGGVEGIITITDLAEAIVGAVALTDEPQENEFVARADGTWLVGGKMAVHEFKEKLDMAALPHEEEGQYQTVGGFVMLMLGRIPKTGDQVEWAEWRVEVVDMDGRRVDKVLVIPRNKS